MKTFLYIRKKRSSVTLVSMFQNTILFHPCRKTCEKVCTHSYVSAHLYWSSLNTVLSRNLCHYWYSNPMPGSGRRLSFAYYWSQIALVKDKLYYCVLSSLAKVEHSWFGIYIYIHIYIT